MPPPSREQRAAALRFIVLLGVVSLFADMAYEGARGVVGPYLQDLGATAAAVGLIAGFGEMIAAALRLLTGRLADRTRAYWTFTILGYALSVSAAPALAFATTWPAAGLLVIAERVGKSLRGPARDVLLSEATGVVGHGFGFGVHTALDQTGAVVGPLIMVAAMSFSHRLGPAFLWLVFPAFATLISLLAAYPARPPRLEPPRAGEKAGFPRVFWTYVVAAGFLALGYVDFPLLAFHWQRTGIVTAVAIPALYAGAMAVNGVSGLLFGRLFDRFGVLTLAAAIPFSLLALPLGFLSSAPGAIAAAVCWGIGMGAQDACLRSGIAGVVPMEKRGGAFGALNAIYGVMWFLGSAAMGLLYGRSALVLVAFGMAAQTTAAILFIRLRRTLAAATAL